MLDPLALETSRNSNGDFTIGFESSIFFLGWFHVVLPGVAEDDELLIFFPVHPLLGKSIGYTDGMMFLMMALVV